MVQGLEQRREQELQLQSQLVSPLRHLRPLMQWARQSAFGPKPAALREDSSPPEGRAFELLRRLAQLLQPPAEHERMQRCWLQQVQ